MFAFGFALMFVLTQMYGIDLSRFWLNSLWLVFFLLLVLVYNQRGWANIHEIFRIPIIDYVLVLVLAGIVALVMRLRAKSTS